MIDLPGLAALAQRHASDLDHQVAPFRLADKEIDTDASPILMGVVNLSRDSAYRESIAVDQASAVRKARVQVAQGAAEQLLWDFLERCLAVLPLRAK